MKSREEPATDITRLLQSWSEGNERAFDQLVPLVYDELHRIAAGQMARERGNVSMQATGLVNELCLRLMGWEPIHWQNRAHFFGVSAQMMRRVLVDMARRRRADRRGGADRVHVAIDQLEIAGEQPGVDIVAIDQALERLAAQDRRKAQVVELRFFGGLSMEEIAGTLCISVRTAHNDWEFSRAWLYRELGRGVAT